MAEDRKTKQPSQRSRTAGPRAERRRAPRWSAQIPLFIYGHSGAAADPFHEEAYSAVVSDCGALLIMTNEPQVGENLLLTNKATDQEQYCRVARLGRRNGPSIAVGIEFDLPAPQFWRIAASPRRSADDAGAEPHRSAL